jgi:hypothetical protein
MYYIQIDIHGDKFYTTKKLDRTLPPNNTCLLTKSFSEKYVFSEKELGVCTDNLNWIKQFLTCEGKIVRFSNPISPDRIVA